MKSNRTMPSKMHQMLIGLINRKMLEKGYLPVAYDGWKYSINNSIIHIPPKIGRHRPDIVGIHPDTRVICIGEAKTLNDLSSKRTKEQFIDYANIIGYSSKEKFELIIGIPFSAENYLLQLLLRLALDKLSNISYIILPEELVEDD